MANQTEPSTLEYLYLTTIGRITGEPREIEIWFVESKGKLYILAEQLHDAQWVKNIERNPRVRVRLGARRFEATARVLDRERDRPTWLTVQRLASEKYGWGDGLPVEIACET
jgi:deazaflavin-dependent oxidoreductase (nitroreductase family)